MKFLFLILFSAYTTTVLANFPLQYNEKNFIGALLTV